MYPTDVYATEHQKSVILKKLHTVSTMMTECQRSRSWAYQMIASYPGPKRLVMDFRTGKKERAVPRIYVQRYLEKVKRGNPYW